MNHRKLTWAKKVPPNLIRRLYEQDAKGIYDEELADDVGIGLQSRLIIRLPKYHTEAICL